MPGKLYIVSTPIGNLEDITLRAINILKEVDYIITEDTREAGKLLMLLELPKKQLISYRDQNHDRALPQILELLEDGKSLGLISDRGTPLVSDPGYKLIREVSKTEHEIIPISGVSAMLAALVISGLPTDRFTFLGFLPKTKGKKIKAINQALEIESTFIIYESPYRVLKTLVQILDEIGDIWISVSKELTKLNEKTYRGKLSEVITKLEKTKIKGEWVILGSNKNLEKTK